MGRWKAIVRAKTESPLFRKSANGGQNRRRHSQQNDRTRPTRVQTNLIACITGKGGLRLLSDPFNNAREYDKVAKQCAAEGIDHSRYLLRLAELELIDRERRMVERRIKAAKFPAVKSLPPQACCACPAGQRISFDFKAMPSLNKMLVMELARCDYISRNENIIAVGNSGTGKTHIGLGLGLAACQKGLAVGFITASALVHELLEARDEKRLLRLQKQLSKYSLLIIDELGYVPLSTTGAELLFEVFSQRYERGSTIVMSMSV